jgi:hypothetical protein
MSVLVSTCLFDRSYGAWSNPHNNIQTDSLPSFTWEPGLTSTSGRTALRSKETTAG